MLTSRVSSVQKRAACASAQPRPAARSVRACVASQQQQQPEQLRIEDASRRQFLMTVAGIAASGAAVSMGMPFPALAEAEYKTLFGLATPPTSYGGYGGNANEVPKYSFEYPADWKSEVPSKVEKGTQGIDCRVVSPKAKDVRAFVITLSRAGEDNKSFVLRDADSTFASFAGADYNLQDALTSATNIEKAKKVVDGIDFYDFDIDSPDFRYLSSVAFKDGKVFALFVRSPTRSFRANEAKLRHIVETFKLL